MIRKFLVCGKQQLFVSSKKLEDTAGEGPTVELLLPIDVWWEIDALMKHMDYLTSANEDKVLVREVYFKILKKVSKFAVSEKDRNMLQEKLHAAGG